MLTCLAYGAARHAKTPVNEEDCMLLDVRTYTCRPGTIKARITLFMYL